MSKEKQQEKKQELAAQDDQKSLETTNASLTFKGNESAEATDILVPRILLMQGTSKWVPDTFQMGDLINSVEEELLAKKGEVLEIIPFVMKKTWEVFTDEKTPQWVRSDVWNAANDKADWQFTEEVNDPDRGPVVTDMKRQRQYSFYCFIVTEDGISEFDLPAIVGFRSSAGFKEGKKIASHFGVMKSMEQPGFTVSWKLSTETIKDGDNSYMKYNVKRGRNVTKEEMEPIYKWLTLLSQKPETIKEHAEEVPVPRDVTQGGAVEQTAEF